MYFAYRLFMQPTINPPNTDMSDEDEFIDYEEVE